MIVSNFWHKDNRNLKNCTAEKQILSKLQNHIWLQPMTWAGKQIQIGFNSAQ